MSLPQYQSVLRDRREDPYSPDGVRYYRVVGDDESSGSASTSKNSSRIASPIPGSPLKSIKSGKITRVFGKHGKARFVRRFAADETKDNEDIFARIMEQEHERRRALSSEDHKQQNKKADRESGKESHQIALPSNDVDDFVVEGLATKFEENLAIDKQIFTPSLNSLLQLIGQTRHDCQGAEEDKENTRIANTFYNLPDMESVLKHAKSITKLGESSFAEVFSCTMKGSFLTGNTADFRRKISCAIKVIPFSENLVAGLEQSSLDSVYREVFITKAMSDLAGDRGLAFIKAFKFSVVKGAFSESLLQAWDDWSFSHPKLSENPRPDFYDSEQCYLLCFLGLGGRDLESYMTDKEITSRQAESIVRQVSVSLAIAEKELEFEHRDLHIGNILVEPCSPDLVLRVRMKESGNRGEFDNRDYDYDLDHDKDHNQDQDDDEKADEFVSIQTCGLKVSIIDYTLSRLKSPDDCSICYLDLEQDTWLFEGDSKKDYQFSVYRLMRDACQNNWESFHPKTNIFWMHYLMGKLASYSRDVKTLHRKCLAFENVHDWFTTHYL